MENKILTLDNFQSFNFQEHGTGCGTEQETSTGENYFFTLVYFPKSFFNLDHPSILSNPLVKNLFDNLPDKIFIKLELFAIGSINKNEAYIFKPWVIGIDNPEVYEVLESFNLYFPSLLFYHLIARLIFMERINQDSFRHIRVLQDIPENTFQRFGLDRSSVEKTLESSNLFILKVETDTKNEILDFYKTHWEEIDSELENKYFRIELNTWFRIILKSNSQSIGFLRFYNRNSSFTGGISLEYIIDKDYRNKGIATEASLCIINYLKKYSYAISLGAEVNDNNHYSIRVLKTLGFIENNNPSPYESDNFHLSLLDSLKQFEATLGKDLIEFSVKHKYIEKHSRYF